MFGFNSLHVQGFRRLADVQLELKPLNVLIGANGSGKTSVLEVFSLLAASAAGRLNQSMSELSGIDANLTNLVAATGEKATVINFDLEMDVPGYLPIKYQISMTPRANGYEILDETLTQRNEGRVTPFKYFEARQSDVRYFNFQQKRGSTRPDWDHNPTESALSQVPKMFKEPENFRRRLASSTHYHVLDVGRRAPIRSPQQMRDARLPGHDGEDLVSCLYTMRETDPDRYEAVEATLRAGFPEFERLNFPPVAAGVLAMTWKDKTSKNPFYMYQLSEGTLRFLWLTTLLQSPDLTAVTMIDEPEVSLHPQLLSLLADLLREASERTQLIVATHADRLLRFLKPVEVVAIDTNDDGMAQMTRADEFDIDRWLKDYTLDEIWQMGRIGARP